MQELEILESDIAILGASLGGVAAALAAAQSGMRVILTEETAWIGGQVTSQAVSALDEYRGVERLPGTRSYGAFRAAIRQHYLNTWGTPVVFSDGTPLNPGNGWVSRLCFEPRVALNILNGMLAPYLTNGQVRILLRSHAVRAEGDPGHLRAVEIARQGGKHMLLRAAYFLDATDLGDLLPLAGIPYVSGAEAIEDTAEPHASPDGPHPGRNQSFTFCFLCEFRPGEDHTIRKPRGYARFRTEQPYSLTLINHEGKAVPYNFFDATAGRPLTFWTYRRAFDAALFDHPARPNDIALINWPSNDYRWGYLIDQTPERKTAVLDEARRLSLGFLYWLQTECQRDDGKGPGYPELKILPEAVGTRSGIAQSPYVRESRRIRSLRRILEQDITLAANPGKQQAAFPDTCGIGSYPMDLHACVGDERTMFAATLPFQIPLGALIPLECDNLIAACKNIGTTHLTNGSYRLQPVEWSIGEAAGALAAHCIQTAASPHAVWGQGERLTAFQDVLRERGVRLEWPQDVIEDGKE